jgi:helix-turn-helix protein
VGEMSNNLVEIKETISKMNSGLKNSFEKVKEEFNDHLDTINQNTNEIQMLYSYLSEIDSKIEKLSERLDELSFTKENVTLEQKFDIQLTTREEEIFLALYTATKPMTTKEIAHFLGLTEELVNIHVYKLISKSIPISKNIENQNIYFSLDKTFKDLQARKNIINLNEKILEQFVNLRA